MLDVSLKLFTHVEKTKEKNVGTYTPVQSAASGASLYSTTKLPRSCGNQHGISLLMEVR